MDAPKSPTSNSEMMNTTSELSFVVQQEEVAAERAERIKEYNDKFRQRSIKLSHLEKRRS
jgi:hypothetical protein